MTGTFDWTAALDTVRGGHTLEGVGRVRALVTVLGVPQPPLHPCEQSEVKRLRDAAARNLAAAEEIEARAS